MQDRILNFIQIFKRFCFSVCLFVCPLIFLTNTTQNPFVIQPLFFSIFGGFFCLCYAVEIFIKKEINFRYSKLDIVVVIFLLSLLISLTFNYFLASNKAALINEFFRKSDYLIYGLIFGFLFAKITSEKVNFENSSYKFFKNIFLWCLAWVLWKVQASFFLAILIFAAGVYLCFVHIKKYGIKEILDVLLCVCFCSSLYGIMQTFGLEFFWVLDISKEFGARSVSTFGNPNFLASFVLLFLPYSSLLFLQAKNKQEDFISGLITLVLALFLVISGTRSAWLGLLVGSLFFFTVFKGFRKVFLNKFLKLFILFLLFCVCTFALISGLKQKNASMPAARISEVKQALSLKTFSLKSKHLIPPLHQRLMMWQCAFDNFKSSPFFGKGVNSFQLNFPYCQGKLIFQNPALDKLFTQANNAHNEYLEILSDGGLFSFTAYIFLLGLFFAAFKRRIRTLNGEEKYFYFALVFGLVTVLIDNTLNITLRTLLVSFAFWFIVSLVNNLNTKNKKLNLNSRFCFGFFILTCFVVGFLICFQVKYFAGQIYELKGYKNLVKENHQSTVDNMEKAIKMTSLKPEPYYVLTKVYANINEIQKAKDIATEGLKYYPAYYEFYFYLASLQYSQQDTKNALENLRKTLSLLPTYTPAVEMFSNILLGQNYVSKEDKKLLEDLTAILPYEPNLPSYLSEIYFKENDCTKASAFAFNALNKNIVDKPALRILANCQNDITSNTFLQKAQKINELKDEIKLKQDKTVFEKIKTLHKEYPDETEVNVLLSEFYFRQGKFCEATDILKLSKNNKFRSKSYNISLSISAQKCGDIETSRQALEEILLFCPYDEFAKNRLKNVKI